MPKTKIEHVTQAFKRLVISGITSKPTAEENAEGLQVLEDMMNELRSRNICSSYVFENEINPNTDSGIDDAYNNAVSSNLAIRIAEQYGKGSKIPPTLYKQAVQSLSNWSARTLVVRQINPPNTQPRGSGNTFRFPRWIRYYRIEDGVPISCDSLTLKVNAVDFFTVDFSEYLLDGSTITSYTVEVQTDGVQLLADVLDEAQLTMQLKGIKAGANTILVTIDTSANRTNPQKIYVQVTE